jgi:acetyl esterase/lipase
MKHVLFAAALVAPFGAAVAGTPYLTPPPNAVFYGSDTEQYVAPCLPADRGPHYGVLIVHGGGWTGEGTGLDVAACGIAAASGLVGLDVHYRLAKTQGAATWPTQTEDLDAAIDLIRNPSGPFAASVIQAPQFCGMGFSAGGHLIGILGAAGKLACVVTNSGPSDMLTIQNPTLQAKFARFVMAGVAMPENCATEPKNLWCVSSPVYVLHPTSAPWLMEYGIYDQVVPAQQTIELAGDLQALGVPVSLNSYPGGHVFNGLPPGTAATLITSEMQWVLAQYAAMTTAP